MSDQLAIAISDLEEEKVLKLVQERLDAGVDPVAIVNDCREGMELVGQRYQSGEYFLSELIMAGEIFKQANALVGARFQVTAGPGRGTVVVGTVKGDIHDIGKDIVSSMLELNGYKVVDLGINVAAETFTRKIGEERPQVIGLSAMLTTTMQEQRRVVEALRESGLREQVKVIVGGAPVSQKWAGEIGADGYGANAELAVKLVKTLTGAA